ncbi:MAG TPA: type II toxin-antitoxin system RelE/ParE family toxin [Pyrinomonadaceae bacterium]|nr:type II toxin-antitoxin system RelE/ParE family toxin [Pyrinomonadaceae bacterium]
MNKPIITREAEEDINETLAYIALDNFQASVRFYDRLVERFQTLAANPKAGRERDDLGEGLRSFPFGNYLIFYRIWAGKVAITRVLHGARDLDEIFS